MLSRIKAVIRREYLERVRTKAFWISTLVVPFFLGAMMIIPAWLAARGGGEFDIAVLDLTGRFAEKIDENLQQGLNGTAPSRGSEAGELQVFEEAEAGAQPLNVRLIPQAPGSDPKATRERLKQQVLNRDFDGLLVLPATLPDAGEPEYVAPNVASFRMLAELKGSIRDVIIADRLTAAGLDPEHIGELTKRVGLRTMKLGDKGEETHDQGQGFILSYVLVLIIYMTVLMYGIYVMRGVLEEKSSHIVEVIVSTVKPFELMLGKILGIGAVGLTQFALWSLLMFTLTSPGVGSAVGMGDMELPTIPPIQLIFFVVYFVLGFLLYGTLYAGVGAAFDTEQEAQNFQGAITVFLVIPLLLIMQILNDPSGTVAVVMSLVPFFTPILMFLRMTLVQVPAIQIIASLVIMIGSIIGATWIVGKIYRIGILMHGSKPKLKDLMRWLREA
ncbi:MAG: ABC transporter permease [bacterium]|nr:ABC transporter permease [bacterium]